MSDGDEEFDGAVVEEKPLVRAKARRLRVVQVSELPMDLVFSVGQNIQTSLRPGGVWDHVPQLHGRTYIITQLG